MDITFTINEYDKDGDKVDDCLLLHFNNTLSLRLIDVNELNDTIEQLQKIKTEITDNYGL